MKKFWIRTLPGIAWFFILLYLLCLPGEEFPKKDWLDKIYFDKIVHFCSFALLTFLFFYPFYKSAPIKYEPRQVLNWIVGLAIAWGIITELIQYFFVRGRNFDPWDMVFDAFGTLAGRAFCLWLMRKDLKIPPTAG